jgi:hypothetical protein
MAKLEARNAGRFKNQQLTDFMIWMRHGASISHSSVNTSQIHALKKQTGFRFKPVYEKL